MAIRKLRFKDDPILRKKSRIVEKIDDKIFTLLEDMIETMYKEEGVGLAAPQVGILKRVIVIDVGDGPIKLINPEIVYEEGEVIDIEGCLSIPGENGKVPRPKTVRVRYINTNGKEEIIEGHDLLARALCHEVDHLNGILFTDKIIDEDE